MNPSLPIACAALDIRAVGNEVVVHDPTHRKVHVMNRAAADVLQLCDGRHTELEIARAVSARGNVDLQRAARDVESVLASFRALELVR